MLKVGGAIDIIARENCCDHAHLPLKPCPFGVLLLLLANGGRSFLVETSSKSTKTEFAATYS